MSRDAGIEWVLGEAKPGFYPIYTHVPAKEERLMTPKYLGPWAVWAIATRQLGLKMPRPTAPTAIPSKYVWVPAWAWWKMNGKKGVRPAKAPKTIPADIWPIYTQIVLAVRTLQHPYVPPVPVPEPPPHPPGINLAPAQAWVFMGENTDKALGYPPYYGIAFTADVGVNEQGQKNYPWPSPQLVSNLKYRGQRVRSWCDCHATMPAAAMQMSAALGLDGWIGEGESDPAFDTAYAAGAKIVVGNLAALRDDQKALIATGKVLFINELYLNQDPSRAARENWENLPVAGRCIASYDARGEADTGVPSFPVVQYISMGKYVPHVDSFYDPGASDADRQALP